MHADEDSQPPDRPDAPPPALVIPAPAAALDTAGVIALLLAGLVTVAGEILPFGSGAIDLPSVPSLLLAAAVMFLVRNIVCRQTTTRQTLQTWRARVSARPDLAAALHAFVATRPAVFAAAYFAVVTIGLAPTANFSVSTDPFINLPARFDAGWYGAIAIDGYFFDRQFTRQRNIAFFPAMPSLMRPLGRVFGSRVPGLPRDRRLARALWAGVFISLAAFLAALVYLSRLSRLIAGDDAARAAPLLLAAYPFAVFFNAPYTEGLFLLGSVAAFYYFHRERWVAASLFGLLVGLSRPNGCFLSIPLAILAVQSVWPRPRLRPVATRLLVAAMPGFGMLLFTAHLYRLTGVWFAWTRMQEAWGRTWGTRPIAQGWEWLTTEGLMAVTRGVPFDTLNTAAVLFALAMLWPVARRLGAPYAAFIVVNVAPPVFAGGALSMGRITSTLFPLFIALAAMLPRRSVPAWAAAFGVMQGLIAALFFTWRELF